MTDEVTVAIVQNVYLVMQVDVATKDIYLGNVLKV